MLIKVKFLIVRLLPLFRRNKSIAVSSRSSFDAWSVELNSLGAEILLLSGLRRERLDDAALELSIGVELGGEAYPRHADTTSDPYDEFLEFAANPGLDYTEVDGSEIGDLAPRQMYLAIAWHYVGIARSLVSTDAVKQGWKETEALQAALWHKMAARKLVEDTIRHVGYGNVKAG